METQEAIKRRASVREFEDASLPREIIKRIVNAGRLAPTARGEEPWEFVVVTDKFTRQKIAQITDHGKFIAQAACCIAIFCRDTKYYLEDGCAATENMLIAATDLGVASCWVAGDKKPYCSQINTLLKVPSEFRLVSMIALGFSCGKIISHPKRPLKNTLHWERF
jgi:nitroreductase